MLLKTDRVAIDDFERGTGWASLLLMIRRTGWFPSINPSRTSTI